MDALDTYSNRNDIDLKHPYKFDNLTKKVLEQPQTGVVISNGRERA
jgi:hypothetical protein